MTESNYRILFNWLILILLSIFLKCCGGISSSSGDLGVTSGLKDMQIPNLFLNPFNLLALDHSKRSKRDAYETLRDLTSYISDDEDTSNSRQLIASRRLYNTSVALTIPFFTFKLPHLTNGGFLVNQAIFGVFSWGVTALTFFLSFIFTGSAPTAEGSRNMKRLSTAAEHSPFNFLGKSLSGSFGMDGLQCLQKVICQSHRSPENRKYGVIASSFRMLFPAPSQANRTLVLEDDPELISPLKSAAIAGKYSKEDCEKLYDCLIDALGSARYLVHWYGHTHNPNSRFLLRMIDDSNYNNYTSY